MKLGTQILIAGSIALLNIAGPALARDQIRIVGSSTVFPFSTAVAERFGRTTSFKTPIVESTGTGGGLKLFCSGVGYSTPDIANASRRIKESEVGYCHKNGVDEVVEIRIGFDGIVLANAKTSEPLALTTKQIFLALAREIPVAGKLVKNPNRTWKEVDVSLPDRKIEVLGPPPTSGTRDAFVEIAMEGGAKQIPMLLELSSSDKNAFAAIAHAIREDGAYVEAGENDNLIVQKLRANPAAIGIFGFSFLDQNEDRVQGSPIDGTVPSFEDIASGQYPISRSLYFYVKKDHVGQVPGLVEYIAEFTSETAVGSEGYLSERGLIPLTESDRDVVRATAEKLELLNIQSPASSASGSR